MDTTDARPLALSLLQSKKAGVLSTLSPEGTPRARIIYYACDDRFNIYFLTFANTRKAEDLRTSPKVAFTVTDDTLPRTIQLEGEAQDITNSPVDDRIIESLFEHLEMNTKFYAPVAHLDRSDIRFYRITPTWVRFGDFTTGHTTAEVLFEVEA